MKKLLSIMMVALMVFALAGCASSNDSGTKTDAANGALETTSENATEEASATSEPEESTEETETTTEEAPDNMTERIVAETFRFLVPNEWEKQEDGSYYVGDGNMRNDVAIYFFGAPRKTDVSELSESLNVQDDNFPEEFVNHLNTIGLYENIDLQLTDSDTATWHNAQETAKGIPYRRLGLHGIEKDSGKNAVMGTVIIDVYDWNEEEFFMIIMESYSVSAMNECHRIIHRTFERIDG